MPLDECFNLHQGTAVSFDGLVEDKGQCLQWASIVNRDVYNCPAFFTPAAKDWWYKFHGSPLEPYYDQIDKGQPIKKGDFIIYDPLSNTDPQGHIDVASKDGSVQNFWAYDSNWNAANFHDSQGFPTLHEVLHNDGFNSKVIGYLRRKDMEPLNPGDVVNGKRFSTGVKDYQPPQSEIDNYVKDPNGWKKLLYDTISGGEVQIQLAAQQGVKTVEVNGTEYVPKS